MAELPIRLTKKQLEALAYHKAIPTWRNRTGLIRPRDHTCCYRYKRDEYGGVYVCRAGRTERL